MDELMVFFKYIFFSVVVNDCTSTCDTSTIIITTYNYVRELQ